MVAVDEDQTKAFIGDQNGGATTSLTVPGAVTVTAASTSTLDDTAVSVAASLGNGIAGMVALDIVRAETDAEIYNTNLNQGTGAIQGDAATVTATSTLTADSRTGAGAGGAVGVGGALNLLDVMSETGAGIWTAASMPPPWRLPPDTNDLSLTTATGALATEGGLAASIGIIEVAAGASNSNLTKAENQALNSVSAVTAFTSGSLITADNGAGLSSADQTAINGSTDQTAALDLLYEGAGRGTSARISGGTITADTLSVSATTPPRR